MDNVINKINSTIKDFMFWNHDSDLAKYISTNVVVKNADGDYDLILNYDSLSRHNLKKDLYGLSSALDYYADCSTVKVVVSSNSIKLALFDMNFRKGHISSLIY